MGLYKIVAINTGQVGDKVQVLLDTGDIAASFIATANKTVANTTTETSLIGTGLGSMTLAAAAISVGTRIRTTLRGTLGTAVVAPNLTIKVKAGSTVIASLVFTALVGSLSAKGFAIFLDIVVRTTGVSGTITANGEVAIGNSASALLSEYFIDQSATIDTTSALTFDVTATWSTASASNTITSNQSFFSIANPPAS